ATHHERAGTPPMNASTSTAPPRWPGPNCSPPRGGRSGEPREAAGPWSWTGAGEPRRRQGGTMTRLWSWLRVLGGAAIVAVVVWRVGTGPFLDGFRLVTGTAVVVALGIGVLTTVFTALRWRLIAHRLGLPLPFGTAVADYYQALFL